MSGEALAELQTYRRMASEIKIPLNSTQGLPADRKADLEITATVDSIERRAVAAARRLVLSGRKHSPQTIRAMDRRDADFAAAGQVPKPEIIDGAAYRGCPWCGVPIRWFEIGASEVPDCREHGVLDFWLVIVGTRPVGFSCAVGGTLWGRL